MSWLAQNYQLIATVLLGLLELASLIPGFSQFSGFLKFFISVIRLIAQKDPIPSDAVEPAKVGSEQSNPKI